MLRLCYIKGERRSFLKKRTKQLLVIGTGERNARRVATTASRHYRFRGNDNGWVIGRDGQGHGTGVAKPQ
jgi:hypothetical protein